MRRAPTARGLTLALGLALWAVVGCTPAPVKWAVGPGERVDFEDARAEFTRTTDVYEGAEGRIFARATWFSPRFAAALADWQSQRAGVSSEARTAAIDTAVGKAREETWFFVALTTGQYEWNDLGQRDGTLSVRLQVGDAWLEPLRIERMSVDAMADRQVVFPYADDLTVGYDIVFPQVTDPGRIRLQIVGIPGRGDMTWDVN